jgi:hypothetical protein
MLSQVRDHIDLERQQSVFPQGKPGSVFIRDVHKPLFVVDVGQTNAIPARLEGIGDADSPAGRPDGL